MLLVPASAKAIRRTSMQTGGRAKWRSRRDAELHRAKKETGDFFLGARTVLAPKSQ
jgi:hypothetical protein